MPKRVIDGEAIWSSTKLASCSLEARKMYPWLVPLADARGCFEITSIRSIYGRVSPILEDLTEEKLRLIFEEYIERGLLFTWAVGSHCFAHWVGSDKAGRLPSPSQVGPREKTSSPLIPKDSLTQYVLGKESLPSPYPPAYRVPSCALALALAPALALATKTASEQEQKENRKLEVWEECYAVAEEEFRKHWNQEPSFTPQDAMQVSLLQENKRDLTVAEFRRRYRVCLQGGKPKTLSWFCKDFDTFMGEQKPAEPRRQPARYCGKPHCEDGWIEVDRDKKKYKSQAPTMAPCPHCAEVRRQVQ